MDFGDRLTVLRRPVARGLALDRWRSPIGRQIAARSLRMSVQTRAGRHEHPKREDGGWPADFQPVRCRSFREDVYATKFKLWCEDERTVEAHRTSRSGGTARTTSSKRRRIDEYPRLRQEIVYRRRVNQHQEALRHLECLEQYTRNPERWKAPNRPFWLRQLEEEADETDAVVEVISLLSSDDEDASGDESEVISLPDEESVPERLTSAQRKAGARLCELLRQSMGMMRDGGGLSASAAAELDETAAQVQEHAGIASILGEHGYKDGGFTLEFTEDKLRRLLRALDMWLPEAQCTQVKKEPAQKRAKTVSWTKNHSIRMATAPSTSSDGGSSDEYEDSDQSGFFDDESEDDDEDSSSMSGPAGTIASLRVENFMNHSNLTLDFISGINFIIGKNGSGKSAIVNATQVALGATASETRRHASVSAFIQDGQTTCKVALTLCNSPKDEAFAYNQYGKTITVERTIRRQGASSYRLLNWKKEVVSRTADEVTRLKDHYFVQVDNPCSVLGQDDAKALTDGTDEFKYKFYLRASGLQMVLDQLCYCTDARRQLEDILNRQTRDLQEKKTELEACEREYEAAQDRIKLRESLEALDKELAWCLVRDERDKVRQYRDELEDLLAKADDDSVDIRRLQLKIDAKEEERNSRMDIVASFNERQEEYRRRHVKLREALTDAKKRRKSKEKEVASDRSAVRERANDQEESENRIRQLAAVSKASDTANEDKALNKVKTDLAGACADVARGQERLEQLEGAIEEVEDAIEKERHEKEHHHNAMEDLGKAKQAAQSCLDSFNVHSNNPDVRFGNDLVRLLAEIDRRASEFTLKPVLVGRYITLKEQRWETAVQSAIGVGNLKTLICTEYRDEELCVKIINELNLRRSCVNFHRMHFDGHSYRDTGKLKLHLFPASNKGFITVLDMITTTRTLVENFLYDKQVYTQLLCEDRDTCMKIVFREQPERNVRKCYQLDGTCYYVQSASQHQVPYQARTNLLSLDNHAAILKAQRDLSDVETRTEDEKKRFVAVLNGFLQEGRTPEQRHADLRAERTRLEVNQGRAGRRMTDLKQQLADIQMETDDGTLAAREDEIRLLQSHSQDMSQEIDRLSTQIETSEQQLDELTQAEKENDEELKRHQRDQMQDETLHEGTNTELTELERDIAKLTHRKRKHEQNKNAIRESARVAQQRKEEAEKAVGTETTKAKRFCEQEEEVVSTATSEELENKKQRIEIRLAVEQRRSGGRSISDIEDALDRATHRNEQATTHMKNVLSTQERVRQGFSARHKKYRQFRQSTELNARKMFHKHMGNRTHAAGGDLRFDHKRRTLQIIAQIGRRSVTNSKTLSGGEKSFTTMSLLMGLGAVTQVPFGIFDEVDVYMDPATREISLQKLAEMARMKKGQRQFLVLTPNEAEVRQNIQEDEGCKIIVMQAPRRFSAGE